MPAIPPHTTDVTDRGDWDASLYVARLRSDEDPSYYARVFAWRDPDRNERTKSAYKLPHHVVDSDGNPGAAHVRGCQAAIAALNGARGGVDIPEEDRRAVYRHLAYHLRDAGIEPAELRSAESIERKVFEIAQSREGDEGLVVGVASVYDREDAVGDVIIKGAFTRTVAENPDVPLLWQHDPAAVIGRARLRETDTGLEMVAQLDLDDPQAVLVRNKLQKRLLNGLSIGFEPRDVDWESRDGRVVRILRDVRVWEVSIVTFPAQPAARVTEVRAGRTISRTTRDLLVVAAERVRSGLQIIEALAAEEPQQETGAEDKALEIAASEYYDRILRSLKEV